MRVLAVYRTKPEFSLELQMSALKLSYYNFPEELIMLGKIKEKEETNQQ